MNQRIFIEPDNMGCKAICCDKIIFRCCNNIATCCIYFRRKYKSYRIISIGLLDLIFEGNNG